MLSFKPTFSLSTFTFIKRLLSSSSLSAIRVVSSAYLRLLIFLPAILIPACASSRPAFLMMYSAYVQGGVFILVYALLHQIARGNHLPHSQVSSRSQHREPRRARAFGEIAQAAK